MDSKRLDEIRLHVTDLVEIFLDNMDADAYITDDGEYITASMTHEGMSSLGKRFDQVPFFDRVAVYSMFLDELMSIGVPYDEDQFEQVPGSIH